MNSSVTRLLLVDDHEVVRKGLRGLLERLPGFFIAGEAGTVAEAVEVARQCQPDVVIMDVRLPDGTGIEACRDIRAELPDTRVLMLTSYADHEAALASIMAGASGFVLKQTRVRELAQAIELIAAGGSLVDPQVSARALARLRAIASGERSDEERQYDLLTEQERRILPFIADGRTNKEIGNELCLSDKTIKNYVSAILNKLGLARRAQAAAYAAKLEEHSRNSWTHAMV